LDHYFITKHSIHNGGDLQIYSGVIFREKKASRTGPRHIWRTYTLHPFFGHEKHTDGSAVGLMILLANVCALQCK
jgi:hypothetical protein